MTHIQVYKIFPDDFRIQILEEGLSFHTNWIGLNEYANTRADPPGLHWAEQARAELQTLLRKRYGERFYNIKCLSNLQPNGKMEIMLRGCVRPLSFQSHENHHLRITDDTIVLPRPASDQIIDI